jgi:hypothetical protein
VVEHLTNKHKALSSIPQYCQNKKEKEKRQGKEKGKVVLIVLVRKRE